VACDAGAARLRFAAAPWVTRMEPPSTGCPARHGQVTLGPRRRKNGRAAAHLRYIQRDGTSRDGERGRLYSATQDRTDADAFSIAARTTATSFASRLA